jgi:fructose-bisphosphate aldolase class I
MSTNALAAIAGALMAEGRGMLAMDESVAGCNRRFEALGIPQTAESRRDFRELLLGAPGLGQNISGVILGDETFRQARADGGSMPDLAARNGIVVGVRGDCGGVGMALHPGETVTEGLDGLRQRLAGYHSKGARFATWRYSVSLEGLNPSRGCLASNSMQAALFAGMCQEAGILPMVEANVLNARTHDLRRAFWAAQSVLRTLFDALFAERVDSGGLLLKTSMVLPGGACAQQDGPQDVADATVQCLMDSVPASVPGVCFLSGRQPPEFATAHLAAMNAGRKSKLPWKLTFCFSRALQSPALELWRVEPNGRAKAQQALLERAAANGAATRT